MNVKTTFKKALCCLWLATCALTATAADRLLIVGNAVWGGYSIDNSITMLKSPDATDVFKTTVYLNGEQEFKFLTTTNWGGLEYRAQTAGETLNVGVESKLVSSEENGDDNKFMVAESANYEIVCDLQNNTILVNKATFQTAPILRPTLWMVGDATPGGWSIDNAFPMSANAETPLQFVAEVNLNAGEFKFAINNQTGFGQTFYVRDAENAEKMIFGGDDNKWNISEAGRYRVSVDLAALSISIEALPSAYTRNVTTGHYGTVCVPYAVHEFSGAKFFKINGYQGEAASPTAIVFEEVTSLEAGMPYLFQATAEEINLTYTGEAVVEALKSRGFVGSFSALDVAENNYVISNNKVQKCGTGCTIAENRAYIDAANLLPYDNSIESGTQKLTLSVEGNTTGILAIQNAKFSNGKCFENGQLVIFSNGQKFNVNGLLVK